MENRESVKVVLIDTQYVKTDATSFKSVVQSLTGKEACVAWIDNRAGTFAGISKNTAKRKRPSHLSQDSCTVKSDGKGRLSKMLSFKDFELPPLEELQCWLFDDYVNNN